MNTRARRPFTVQRACQMLIWLGAAVLVAGFASAAAVWFHQTRLERKQAEAQAAGAPTEFLPLDSRKHVRDVEMYYGRLGVLMEQGKNLLHGKPLAKTI